MGAPIGNKYALGNRGGRPTKYTPELVEAAWDYVYGGYLQCDDEFPNVAGLGLVIGVSRETITEWRKAPDKKEFSDIYSAMMQRQQQLLLKNGVNCKWSSKVTCLLLGKHGYAEKHESDNKNTNETTVGASIELLDEIKKLEQDIMNANKECAE
jgi:hypothetical protein